MSALPKIALLEALLHLQTVIVAAMVIALSEAPLHLQTVIVAAMVVAAKLHAHPLERAWLLLPFFIGAAEIASGVSGL